MFCQNCGKKINNDADFCSSCGQKTIEQKSKIFESKFFLKNQLLIWLAIFIVLFFAPFYFLTKDSGLSFIIALFIGGGVAVIITLIREHNRSSKFSNSDTGVNKDKVKEVSSGKKRSGFMWASYGLAGLIFVLTKNMTKMVGGEFAVPIVSISAGFIYYSLTKKYSHKKNLGIWLFPVLLFVSIIVIFFLTVFLTAFLTK